MTERAGVATMTDVREQMADFGRPFGPASCQESLEVSRRANFRRHDVQLRQVDATHPALDTPATETQLPSNIPDITARFIERSDFIEHRLAGGFASAAHQTFVRRDVRAPV